MLFRAGDNCQDAFSGKTQKETASDKRTNSWTQRRSLDKPRKKKNFSCPEEYIRSANRSYKSRKQKGPCPADLIYRINFSKSFKGWESPQGDSKNFSIYSFGTSEEEENLHLGLRSLSINNALTPSTKSESREQ